MVAIVVVVVIVVVFVVVVVIVVVAIVVVVVIVVVAIVVYKWNILSTSRLFNATRNRLQCICFQINVITL